MFKDPATKTGEIYYPTRGILGPSDGCRISFSKETFVAAKHEKCRHVGYSVHLPKQ